MNTKVVLFPKGTLRQEIDLGEWVFPNLRTTALLVKRPNLINSLNNLADAMDTVIDAVLGDTPLPSEVFIPDLWHYRGDLPKLDAEEMWHAVGAATCIVASYYRVTDPMVVRHNIGGTLFLDPKY